MNLRVASLRLHPPDAPNVDISAHIDPIVEPGILSTSRSDGFLPHPQEFEITLLLPHDRVLSVLPEGLQKLVIEEYPVPHTFSRYPRNLYASQLLAMLADVCLPAVTYLELWYRTDPSDEALLHRLPRTFAALQYLEMHRFIGPFLDDAWNPGSILKDVLPEFKHLRVFSLEPDAPERRGRRPPPYVDASYARYIRRLKAVAEEIVARTPWVDEIQMYVAVDNAWFWEPGRFVVSGPSGTVGLRLANGGRRHKPEICAILEGPVVDNDATATR
ncbi:hypothetical protein B0H19DRAFT_544225 [Mycena capillaripes]|nr:hypothetical protein B0H19DRAFT_544225 [Mycena capillaripes]